MGCASRFSLRVLHSFVVVFKIWRELVTYNLIDGFFLFSGDPPREECAGDYPPVTWGKPAANVYSVPPSALPFLSCVCSWRVFQRSASIL